MITTRAVGAARGQPQHISHGSFEPGQSLPASEFMPREVRLECCAHYRFTHGRAAGKEPGKARYKAIGSAWGNLRRREVPLVGFYERCGFAASAGTSALFLDKDDEMTQEVVSQGE